MPSSDLPELFRRHAAYCARDGAPLYAELLERFAQDWEQGGPVREICAGWEDAPAGHVVQLRLLGALHRLVLTRQAPMLATYYHSVGGQGDPRGVWEVARPALAEHAGWLRAQLAVAPQTNETGRAAALVAGVLLAAGRHGVRRVRLLELGASAGLNLRVARFRVSGQGWAWGPPGSPVDLSDAVHGVLPAAARAAAEAGVAIVSARGCDLSPVDPRSGEGRLRLSSFVWPDHTERFARLAGALALAAEHEGPVDAAPAASWLREQLAEPDPSDVLTVVWHSVMRQYVSPQEWALVEACVDEARRRMPLAFVGLELAADAYAEPAVLSLDGCGVARAPAHGVPVALEMPAGLAARR